MKIKPLTVIVQLFAILVVLVITHSCLHKYSIPFLDSLAEVTASAGVGIDTSLTSNEVLKASGEALKLRPYVGKRVRWTGKLQSSHLNRNTDEVELRITFPGHYKGLHSATHVFLMHSQTSKAVSLNNGQVITVEGTIRSSFFLECLELEDAVIVEK